jgi:hypothetical protein
VYSIAHGSMAPGLGNVTWPAWVLQPCRRGGRDEAWRGAPEVSGPEENKLGKATRSYVLQPTALHPLPSLPIEKRGKKRLIEMR